MDIRIKSIKLLNFKGQRNVTMEFSGESRTLLGTNATGKTTMFDAFTWALFGKASHGAAQFDIKTLTPDNEVIWRLPHSVTVELLVDGNIITIRREYEEKWVKTRGETEETFRGHEVNRFWNDVPCSAAEFDRKVAELCDESLFRLITNPAHFNSLDDKEKMRLLNTLEGNTTDAQFMAATPEFAEFLTILNGKSLDEYKRELASKIHATNAAITTDHTRLDEVKRGMPQEQDWVAIENEIGTCTAKITHQEGLRADVVKQMEEQGKERIRMQEAINADELKLSELGNAIRTEAMSDYNELRDRQIRHGRQVETMRNERADAEKAVGDLNRRKEAIHHRLDELAQAYKSYHAEVFAFDESRGVCPTCKQPLPAADVNSMRETMLVNFNKDKARRLSLNVEDGNNVRDELKGVEGLIADYVARIAEIDGALDASKWEPALTAELTQPDSTPIINADPRVVALRDKIATARAELAALPVASVNSNGINDTIRELTGRKSELERHLYVRSTIKAARERIAEIEKSIRENGQHLLGLERDANTIKEIQKAKALSVEARINSMFSLVRFKMVSDQINGGDKQVCEATVGGVPYSSGLNTGARINAGLDIINAFCRHNGTTAPIFVDNAEAVDELIPTQSQVISLVKRPMEYKCTLCDHVQSHRNDGRCENVDGHNPGIYGHHTGYEMKDVTPKTLTIK